MTNQIPESGFQVPPILIADTHALVWHLIGDRKLGPMAEIALQAVDEGQSLLVIPAVVLAELFLVAEKGRVTLSSMDLTETISVWQKADNIRLSNLTPKLVFNSAQVTAIPDIFDRLIVTEARILDVPLITRDPIIINSQLVSIIW